MTKKTPPAYGLSDGPIIVACQWNISSATGPVKGQRHAFKTDLTSAPAPVAYPTPAPTWFGSGPAASASPPAASARQPAASARLGAHAHASEVSLSIPTVLPVAPTATCTGR